MATVSTFLTGQALSTGQQQDAASQNRPVQYLVGAKWRGRNGMDGGHAVHLCAGGGGDGRRTAAGRGSEDGGGESRRTAR